jgi:ATP-dependent Clp protease ATP-binding subunit ClpC
VRDIDLPVSLRSGLESFTRDLTAAAAGDELDPVLCRDQEIERTITILMRQSKNNPVLVGEAGVGKTAVAEGLAQRISSGRVPQDLKGTRILSLSHMDLIAGTSFRGQYEKRLQSVVREAAADPGVILFIDELHNLIGAGSALGAPMDAANMLKPALAGGELRVIGATTQSEYERYICGDSALERRFQPVNIRELDRGQTLEVLRARRPRFELHHVLAITDAGLEAAVDHSLEYLPDRLQPDRSIDLLDESCAHVRFRLPAPLPQDVVDLRCERQNLISAERRTIQDVLAAAGSKGTPLERFSRGTYRMIETMGIGLEKIVTGQTTPRRELPVPDSVRRLRQSDPAGRLAAIHYERLRVEDMLRTALTKHGILVTDKEVIATAGKQI